jgi:exosortase K
MESRTTGMPSPRARSLFVPELREFALLVLLVVLVCLARAGYDQLGAAALWPLLDPTAAAIGAITNAGYRSDPIHGIAFPSLGLVLDRSCAGGHFMLMLFALSLWWMRRSLHANARTIVLVTVLFIAAYVLTIVGNTMRVFCTLSASRVDPTGWLAGTNTMHQLIGITVQLFLLIFTHGILIRYPFRSALRA